MDDGYGYGEVYAIATHNSDVYVGGYFALAGGSSANNIARWAGNAWHPLGAMLASSARDPFGKGSKFTVMKARSLES